MNRSTKALALGLLVTLAPLTAGAGTYTVRPGDTLGAIASRHNTSVTELVRINSLSNPNLIPVGQTLTVTENRSYTIKRGDTLAVIARNHNTTVDAIVSLNNINNPNLFQVGQTIQLPSQNAPSQPTATSYTVKRGDTLGLIARNHNTTVDDIIKLNNISNPNTIYVGQVLRLTDSQQTQPSQPAPATPQRVTYTVKRGDQLGLIAYNYQTTVSEIIRLNNLSNPDSIFVGQTLVIFGTPRSIPNPYSGEFYKGGPTAPAHWDYVNVHFPIGAKARITDITTGLSYEVVRFSGFLHADVEPVTAADTAIMFQIYNNRWSWTARPVVVEVNGHRFAASINGMPHDIQTNNRNNFPGHSCIHFLGSRNHFNQQLDSNHQANIQRAIGK